MQLVICLFFSSLRANSLDIGLHCLLWEQRAHLITNASSVMGLCTKDSLTWSQNESWNWEEKLHTGAMLHEHTRNPNSTEIPAAVPVWVSLQTMIKQPFSDPPAALYSYKCSLACFTQMSQKALHLSGPALYVPGSQHLSCFVENRENWELRAVRPCLWI